MFCENAVAWKLKLSFRKELKHILAFLLHDIRLQKIRPLWWTTTYISPKAKTIQSSVLTHFTSGVTNVTVRIDIKKQNKKRIQVESSNRCVHLVWLMVQSGHHGVKSCLDLHFDSLLWQAFQKSLSLHAGIIWYQSWSLWCGVFDFSHHYVYIKSNFEGRVLRLKYRLIAG